MVTYLTTTYLTGKTGALAEKELPRLPSHIDVTPLEGSHLRGEPIDADPFPVRWDDKLGAYVRV
jgi:hypothetical protein